MKKLFLVFLIALPLKAVFAQFDLSASMGLDLKYMPSYRDYINYAYAPAGNKLNSFSTAIDFTGELGYQLNEKIQFGFEYSVQLDSYNNSADIGGYSEISYVAHRPSILAYYLITGEGYKFKFGGGLGARFVALEEYNYETVNYTASGVGLVLKIEGNTRLGDNLYALIGTNFRYDFTGELESSNGQKIINPGNGENVNMNSLSIGIKLGVAYYF